MRNWNNQFQIDDIVLKERPKCEENYFAHRKKQSLRLCQNEKTFSIKKLETNNFCPMTL